MKQTEDEHSGRLGALTPNTNQFDKKLKRSRTELFDTRKYGRWQPRGSSSLDTWAEVDDYSTEMYHYRWVPDLFYLRGYQKSVLSFVTIFALKNL